MVDATYSTGGVYRNRDGNLVVPTGKQVDIESGGALKIAGVAVTATAAELNAVAGTGLSAAELAVLDAVVAGTVAVGKAVVPTTGKTVDELNVTLLKIGTVDKTAALAAAVAAPVAGAAAGYKVARGVAAITGSGTVITGLTTVVAVLATAQDDLDGDTLAGVSASIGDQAGAPAAGSVYLKCWKNNADGDATMVAAGAAKNVNWVAIGT